MAVVLTTVVAERRERDRFALLERYCTDCHNRAELAGELSFEGLTLEEVPQHAEQFEAAIVKLRGRLMPPPGNPQPTADEVEGLVATLERVYAGCLLATRDATPEGALAHQALVELLVRGSLFRDAIALTRQRLTLLAIARWLAERRSPGQSRNEPAPTLEQWLTARVVELGVQSGDDLALLSPADFVAPELPYETRGSIESDYPMTVSVGDASYRADYDLSQNQVTLQRLKGSRSEAPTLAFLPKFPGLRIVVEGPRGLTVVRARG